MTRTRGTLGRQLRRSRPRFPREDDQKNRSRRVYSRAPVAIGLCLLIGFRPEVFFSLTAIFGVDYKGSEDSVSYTLFLALTTVVAYGLLAVHIVRHHWLSWADAAVVLLPAFMLAGYLAGVALDPLSSPNAAFFLQSLVLACPAAVAGMLLAKNMQRHPDDSYLEWLMLLLTASIILSALDAVGGNAFAGVGGASYQTASYLGALAFNLNLYFLLFGRVSSRSAFMASRSYKLVTALLLPLQLLGVLLSGGRGGFVLIAAGAVIQMVIAWRFLSARLLRGVAVALAAMVSLLAWGIPWVMQTPERAMIIGRVFAYVGDKGIDWSGTSGRDTVYRDALANLDAAPFQGYGLFRWGSQSYPHNLVLEWLLNGGILYAFLWLVAVVALACRIAILSKREIAYRVIIPLALYPAVMLQFSGSYWLNGAFWFVLAFCVCAGHDRPTGTESRIQ